MSILLTLFRQTDFIILLFTEQPLFLLKNYAFLSQHHTRSAGTGKVRSKILTKCNKATGPHWTDVPKGKIEHFFLFIEINLVSRTIHINDTASI